MQSDLINEVVKALTLAQSDFKKIKKDKTAKVNGKTKEGKWYEYTFDYADLGDLMEVTRPTLNKHGLAISQPIVMDGGAVIVRTRLLHESGQFLECDYPACSIHGDHQKMAAAITYARKGGYSALIGIVAEDDKNADAADAAAPERKSQANLLKDGDWEQLQRELYDETTKLGLARLHNTWRREMYPHLSAKWNAAAEEAFEKRGEEITKEFNASLKSASNADLDQLALEHDERGERDPADLHPLEAG